jgi:multiple sugar transport system substrate-binding protein
MEPGQFRAGVAIPRRGFREEKMKIARLAAATLAVASLYTVPARADVSIMYAEWLSSLVEPGIKSFEAATGEKVKAIKLPKENYVQRVSLDLSSGTAADVIQIDSFVVPELASSNYLQPLDDMIAGWDQYPSYSKALMKVVSLDNHVFGLPTDTDVRMLWYDKKVMAKAGIPTPWQPKSWADVLAAARQIKDKAGVKNAFVLPAGTKQAEATTMQGFYLALLGADTPDGDRNRLRDWKAGKWIGDSPAIRRALGLYKTVYIDEKLAEPSLNYGTDPRGAAYEAIRNDQIGILSSGSFVYTCIWDCTGVNVPPVAEREALVGWTPWPGSGQPGAPATSNISGGWAIGINKAAKNKDAAFKLLTTIFDKGNFGDWTVKNARMAVRSDIAGLPEYAANGFLDQATKLVATTTGRDTYPGYQVVSALVQQMTADILDGASIDVAVKTYHDALVDEFGEDKVEVLK